MFKSYYIKYEKKFHLSEKDAILAGVDAEKENNILIDKSLECADEISELILDMENIDIIENSIDYDVHVKNNCVPIVGKLVVNIAIEASIDTVIEALSEQEYIISEYDIN